jgi:D-alanyl-lipoteichoic acid acyltransferase DltB (MBOAT superfamily)
MLFHSLDFVVFLLVVLALYWSVGHRLQNVLLLVASYVFYGYVHPWFLILLAGTTFVDYAAARAMGRYPERKRLLLGLSLTSNLGVLGFFKYFGFFVDAAVDTLHGLGWQVSAPALSIVLPVGISFYTFQSLSYTIDVYRGLLAPRRSFIDVALFLSLFPQLVAGPIERATRILPQVESPRRFDPGAASSALALMTWGFFKKLVVADNVGVLADKVFGLSSPGFVLLWVGVLAFCVQIYADFSAYSDIARGSARLLGFELMKNFDHPYLAQTPSEFWRRWHISLSTWFRDYVYIPLGGSRGSPARHRLNLFLVFLLSGFWHGASWNYLLWGAYHGLLLILYQWLEARFPRLLASTALTLPRWALMFGLSLVGWLLFRETNVTQLAHDLTLWPGSDTPAQLKAAGHLLGLLLLYALPLVIDDALYLLGAYRDPQPTLRSATLQGMSVALLVIAIAFLHIDVASDFIYFQF